MTGPLPDSQRCPKCNSPCSAQHSARERIRLAALSLSVTVPILVTYSRVVEAFQAYSGSIRHLPIAEWSPVKETIAYFWPDPTRVVFLGAGSLILLLVISNALKWRLSTFLALFLTVLGIHAAFLAWSAIVLLDARDLLSGP